MHLNETQASELETAERSRQHRPPHLLTKTMFYSYNLVLFGNYYHHLWEIYTHVSFLHKDNVSEMCLLVGHLAQYNLNGEYHTNFISLYFLKHLEHLFSLRCLKSEQWCFLFAFPMSSFHNFLPYVCCCSLSIVWYYMVGLRNAINSGLIYTIKHFYMGDFEHTLIIHFDFLDCVWISSRNL